MQYCSKHINENKYHQQIFEEYFHMQIVVSADYRAHTPLFEYNQIM